MKFWGIFLSAGLIASVSPVKASINLDFSGYVAGTLVDSTATGFSGASGLRYTDVADVDSSGVSMDAIVVAVDPYPIASRSDTSRNGAFGDDININLTEPRGLEAKPFDLDNRSQVSVRFQLQLFAGGGTFDQLYTSPSSFSYSLTFWDIDGREDFFINNNYRGVDGITMHTASTYTVAQTNRLIIEDLGNNGFSFTGNGQPAGAGGEIDGQNSIEAATVLSADQAQNSVVFDYSDTNVVEFSYTISDGEINRNLFIDGGDLVFDGGTPTEQGSVVPEPSSAGLIAGVLGLLFVFSRRRRL